MTARVDASRARELLLPWPPAALSPNARNGHWGKRKREAQQAREVAFYTAREAGWCGDDLPQGRLHLWIDFYRPRVQNMPDDDNMLARFKAYRDGIADALGIDDARFVSHPFVQDEVRKGGQVRVRISGGPEGATGSGWIKTEYTGGAQP
ncbi:MAG: hypothetical protein J0L59_08795 [Xanthomonadales bacterium]|nr:hypothetical protein [Xanthomonadales bacterium]